MVLLSSKQIDAIHDLLVARGVAYDALRMDLLDHLCCMVEHRMDSGDPFERALTESAKEFGPQGFEKTQEETLYLLTSKHRKMKTITSIFGIIASSLTLAGLLLKILHLPFAGILLILGIGGLIFTFLPMMLAVRLHESQGNQAVIINVLGVLCTLVFLVAITFKIMYWPYANLLLTVSLSALTLLFIPAIFLRSYKKAENKLMSVTYVLAVFTGVLLLYKVTTAEPSLSVSNGMLVMNQSIRSEVENSNAEREELMASMQEQSPRLNDLALATEELSAYSEHLRWHIIALSQEVSADDIKNIDLENVKWLSSIYQYQDRWMDDSSEFNVHELGEKMRNWKSKASALGVEDAQLDNWFPMDSVVVPHRPKMAWEKAHFSNGVLVAVVTNLDKISLTANQRFLQLATREQGRQQLAQVINPTSQASR